jgi:hypothetical protein
MVRARVRVRVRVHVAQLAQPADGLGQRSEPIALEAQLLQPGEVGYHRGDARVADLVAAEVQLLERAAVPHLVRAWG